MNDRDETERTRTARSNAARTRDRLFGAPRKRFFLPLAVVILLVLASPFVLLRIDSTRVALIEWVLAQSGARDRFRISIDKVERFDPRRLTMVGVRMDVRDTDGRWQRIGEIRRVDAHWSLREAVAGHARMRALQADSVRLIGAGLRALSAGAGTSGPRRQKSLLETGLPSAAIDRLRIAPLVYTTERGDSLVASLALSAMQSSKQGFFTRIDSGSVALDCCGRFDVRGGIASMVTGGRVRVSDLAVMTADFRGRVFGEADFSTATPAFEGGLEWEWMSPNGMAGRFGLPIALAPEDSLRGEIRGHATAQRADASFEICGRLRGESVLAKGRIARADDELRISDLIVSSAAASAIANAQANLRSRACLATVELRSIGASSAWLPWMRTLSLARRFDGTLRAKITWPRGKPVEIEGDCDLTNVQPWRLPAQEIRFAGRMTAGDAIIADELTARFPGNGRVVASGSWPLGSGAVNFTAAAENIDLASLPRDWNVPLAGVGSGDFVVSGDPRDPQVSGRVGVRDLDYRGWRADSLIVDSLDLEPVRLRGEFSAAVWNLVRGSATDGLDVRVNAVRETERVLVAAQADGNPGRIHLLGEVDPRGEVLLQELALDMRRLGAWSLERPFRGGWGRDRVWSDTLALRSDTARLLAAADWRPAEGDVRGGLSLVNMPAATVARMLNLADTLTGTCALEIDVSERLPDPRVVARLSVDDLAVDSLALGDGELHATWRDTSLLLGPVTLRGPGHGLAIDSLRIESGRPLLANLSSGAARDSLRFSSWRGGVSLDSLSLEAFELLAARTQLSPALPVTNAHSRMIGGRLVPIRVVTPWDSAGQIADTEPIVGTLRGTVDISGSPVSPEIQFDAAIAGLRVTGVPLGEVEFAVAYSDSLASLEQLRFAGERGAARAHGRYPIALGVLPFRVVLLPQAADGQITLEELDLAVLSALTRWVPEASGSVSGQLVLEGAGTAPRIRGSLDLENGGFRIPGRSERVHSANAQLDVRDNRLSIRSMHARTGRAGTVTAVGTFGGSRDFDLSAHVENARVFDEGLYEFLATADLHAYTAPAGESGEIVPTLRGTAFVHSGTITQNLTEAPRVKPAPPRTPWRIDLDVETSGQVRVRQVNANVELGEGSLAISYRWPWWTVTGTQEIASGTYRLLNNTFTITAGTLEFRDTGAGPEVVTNVEAETIVAIPDAAGGPGETVTIQVNVHGKPDELAVDLSSVPPLGEEEILELLSYGRFTRSGRFEPVAGTQWLVLNTLVDRIESNLLEQNPIFSRLTVGTGSSTEDPVRVTLRPIVRPGFTVNYSQDLTQNPAGELMFDYRLSRMLFLHGGMVHRGEGGGGLIDEYSLDLKFRFEYE